MKPLYSFIIGVFLGFPNTAFSETQIETKIGSFFHQITLQSSKTQTQLNQWVAPIKVRLPLAKGNFSIQTALMYVEQRKPLAKEIRGTISTKLTGTWPLGKNSLFSLYTSIPTGKRSLASQDTALAQALMRNDLNFPVKTYGEGFDIGGALSLARNQGHFSLGIGLAFLKKGPYSPIQTISNYKPGDEATFTLGLDYFRNHFTYRLTGVGTLYFTDRFNGLVNFQNGKQLLLQASGQYENSRFRFNLEISKISSLKNLKPTAGPGTSLLYELQNSNRNDLRLHLKASWTPKPFIYFFASEKFKYLSSSTSLFLNRGSAHLWESGAGISLSLGNQNHFIFRATHLDGSIESGTIQISGFNLRGTFTFNY